MLTGAASTRYSNKRSCWVTFPVVIEMCCVKARPHVICAVKGWQQKTTKTAVIRRTIHFDQSWQYQVLCTSWSEWNDNTSWTWRRMPHRWRTKHCFGKAHRHCASCSQGKRGSKDAYILRRYRLWGSYVFNIESQPPSPLVQKSPGSSKNVG